MTATSSPRATILVIDHNRTSRAVLGRRLEQGGHRAVLCQDGAEALALILAHRIDLVLLDTAMPGAQVLRDLRGSRETADLPVIMLTAHSDPAALIEMLVAGADDHIAKPFDFDMLAARIARVLARARRIAELKRANAALDARIATRAIELGEANTALAATRIDRQRLIASIQVLNDQLVSLSETSASR